MMLAPGRLDRHPGSWARTAGQLRRSISQALGHNRDCHFGQGSESAQPLRGLSCVAALSTRGPGRSDSVSPGYSRRFSQYHEAYPGRQRGHRGPGSPEWPSIRQRQDQQGRDRLDAGEQEQDRLLPRLDRLRQEVMASTGVRCGAAASVGPAVADLSARMLPAAIIPSSSRRSPPHTVSRGVRRPVSSSGG